MSKLFLAFSACLILAFPAQADASEMALDKASGQYAAALKRSARLANKALPLIQEIDRINEAASKVGQSPKDYLDEQAFREYDAARSELHRLYSLQAFENAFTRDIAVLNKLYETAIMLHGLRARYTIESGTGAGLDTALEEHVKELSKQDRFYLKLLRYIEKLVPPESAPEIR